MSDDDWMDDGSGDDDYGFEYSEEEEEDDDVEIQIQNTFYSSKGNIEGNPTDALEGFHNVVQMEQEKGDWGFKSLKQIVKLQFKLGNYEEMMKSYREMLTYIKNAVTRNYSEKCINSILEFLSTSQQMDLLREFYETTLAALKLASNDRLWFKTNLKLGKLWFDRGEYQRLAKILKDLLRSCQNEDGSDDEKKGTQLLEIFALEIQMYTETKNNQKLKALYHKSLGIKSAIPHPRILGVVRECGGKMHMAESQWEKAHVDFFEAFKNYDEAGSPRRIQCLKYLVLATMLMQSEINPFDSTEAKPHKNHSEIVAMTSLVNAYQQNQIHAFEKILRENEATIMADPFIRLYIEDLLKSIRTQVLLKTLKPYTRIRLPFISRQLNIPEKDVETLVVSLILDRKILGKIDQVNSLLILDSAGSVESQTFTSVDKWATQLAALQTTVTNKLVV
eukprot:TRINITY_DN9107_c0_g1_i1.p1 TRINITY_DN9107_c0_g1~~TRINITY_DN9107_c0_g1_i1.p1  ORF type:complete len:448 (-),score=157.92 TRINITY_DN9107_c0_g1_i1:166-1509(-)